MAAGLEPGTFGKRSVEFALSTLKLVASVRRMLKSKVPQRNISRVLLNLIKRLILVIFKGYLSFPMLTQLAFMFSL